MNGKSTIRKKPEEHQRDQRFKWPKVELHCHLEGVPRLETIYELGNKRRKSFNGRAQYQLPYEESWSSFEELKELIIIPEGESVPSLLLFLEKFKFFMYLFQGNPDAIYRLVYEAIEDAYKDRIVYIEFRFCPFLLASHGIEPYFKSFGDLTAEDVLKICHKAMIEGEKVFGVKSKLILASVVGLWDYAMPIAKLALKYKEFVCGVDIAGYENGHIYNSVKERQQVAAYEFAMKHNIFRTAHAGEAVGPSSIQNALDILKVHRIGHGYHLVENESLYERVQRENIHLECCLTSCCKIRGYWNDDFLNHPIKRFLDDKFNCSLSTDDPTIFQNSLSIDYRKALERFDVSENTLMESNLNAAKSAFLPDDEKQSLVDYLTKEYKKFHISKF